MRAKATETIFSSRLRGPSDRRASRAAVVAPGVACTPGGSSRYSTGGSRRIAARVGTDEATSHEPKSIFRPKLLRYLDPDRIGGRGGQPEGRGDGEARHPAEHEVGAERTGLRVIRHRAGTLGEREDDREEHAAAGGIARERGSDRRVGEKDAVGESKGRAPEGAHHDEADAAPQSRFHDGASDEERHDHQEHTGVREAPEGLGGRDRAREDRGRHRQRRRGEQRKRIHDDGDDGPCEDGEEVPRGFRQPRRHGGEPDAQRQRKRHSPLDKRPEIFGGRTH